MIAKVCQKCKKTFNCNRDNIAICECFSLTINIDTQHFLAANFKDCLCNYCLIHYEKLILSSQGLIFPKASCDLIQDVHYYMEDGFLVFTELYHFLRGHCCKSGCRHCVYGFEN